MIVSKMPEVSVDKVRVLDTLKLHTSDVTTCDFDSSFRFASGSSDKKVVVCEWQPSRGFTETVFSPVTDYKYAVTKVKFISEEHELITASADGCIQIINAEDGDLLHILTHTNLASIRTFCYVPKFKYLISAADDGSVCFWDLANNNNSLTRSLKMHEECVAVACVSVDSRVLLTGDTTGFVKLWNALNLCDTAEVTASSLQPSCCIPDCHDLGISQADFSPIFNVSNEGVEYRFISGGNDNLLKVWKLMCCERSDGSLHCAVALVFTIHGHGSVVTDVKFSVDGLMAASTSLDKTVRVWAINECGYQCLAVLNEHKRYVTTCAFSSDGTLLATGSNDKTVIIWDLTGSRTKDEPLIKPSPFNSLPSSPFKLNSLPPSPFKLKNTSTLLQKIDNLGNSINSCAFSASNLLAAGGTDKLVRLWHPVSTTKYVELSISPLPGHQYAVNQVEFSSCSRYLASCSIDGTAIVWNVTDYTQVGTVHSIEGGIKCCRFSPDSRLLATGGDYETVCVWRMDDLQSKVELTGHTDAVSCLAFTNDSRYLASGCLGGSVRVWCAAPRITICLLLRENVHDLGLNSVDFCVADNYSSKRSEYSMATCGNDSLVKLWMLRIVDELTAEMHSRFSLTGHGGDVTCVRFSPTTCRVLASTATDKTARIWDTISGICLHVLDSKEALLTSCAFSYDGLTLATGTLDKSIFLWDLRKVIDESVNHFTTARTYYERLPADGMADCPLNEVNEFLDRVNLSDFAELNVPHEFICPITQQLMVHPVLCLDGYTYERSAIEAWFSSRKVTSPMTNEPLIATTFASNDDLRDRIAQFLEEIKRK